MGIETAAMAAIKYIDANGELQTVSEETPMPVVLAAVVNALADVADTNREMLAVLQEINS